ncbi:MAG: nucleotidyltransferase family protein [Deltaproteobacteria bacterium]|nr:nucleotidyltransferase family protein [Deltaproteobacteria bacterium]
MLPTSHHSRSFLSGIILAAGASRRMGQPKQLMWFGDRPLLQHVLEVAAASCLDEIVLVLGHRAEAVRQAIQLPVECPVTVVVNADYEQGQSTSLRAGLSAADSRADGAAVLLGDQPGVTGGLIGRVAAAFAGADAPVARPLYCADGRRIPGHPVFLARRIWPEVDQLQGDHGARALLAAHPDWVLEVSIEGAPPADIDTWDDYRRTVPPAARGAGS